MSRACYHASVTEQFTDLAPIYDALMAGIPYDEWVDYVQALAVRHGHRMGDVLDVGCGTGTVARLLADSGCRVTGFDISENMIREAVRKNDGRSNPRFFACPMQRLDLPDRFDTAVSLFDSLNYITDPDDLREGVHRVHRHVIPGGLFIFDMNTPYALEQELFTQSDTRKSIPVRYSWKSRFNHETRLTRVEMTFQWDKDGLPMTTHEVHHQRAYEIADVETMLDDAGFETLEILEAYTMRKPVKRTDRVYIVARRPMPNQQ